MSNQSKNTNNQQIRHLRQFYSPMNKLFQQATQLPQFFMTNLVDDARVVKYFHDDPQANIRIFYYQYLKLCFEIDNVDYQSYIEKIYELIRTEGFEFTFEDGDRDKEYKNAQYKSILIDFFEIMNSSSLTIDTVLSQYPILDDVFTNFFRTVVIIASVANEYSSYIDKNELFDFLSSFFSVDISSYDKCLKFVQSDIFVYEEDPYNIYMAYIKDQEEEVQQSYQVINTDKALQNSAQSQHQQLYSQNEVNHQQEQAPQITIKGVQQVREQDQSIAPSSGKQQASLKPRAKTIIKQSYIQGQFADYTSFGANFSSLGKNVPVSAQKQIFDTIEQNTITHTNQNSEAMNQAFDQVQATINIQDNQKQLKKVFSGDINVIHSIESNQQVVASQKVAEGVEKSQKNPWLNKGNSQPNLLSAQNNQRLVQSYYDHGQSEIKPDLKDLKEHSDLTNSKQSRKSKDIKKINLYSHYQEPTKDPGFGQHVQFVAKPAQSTIYQGLPQRSMAESHVQRILGIPRQQKPQSKLSEQCKPFKQSQPQQSLFHKPQIPMPTLLTQLNANSRTVTSSRPQKQSYLNEDKLYNLPLSSEPLKLNVTKQFTNSIVMKSMKEPHKSNVYQIRERAREFRKNIYQQFNYQSNHQGLSTAISINSSSQHNVVANLPSQSMIGKLGSQNFLGTNSNTQISYQNTTSVTKIQPNIMSRQQIKSSTATRLPSNVQLPGSSPKIQQESPQKINRPNLNPNIPNQSPDIVWQQVQRISKQQAKQPIPVYQASERPALNSPPHSVHQQTYQRQVQSQQPQNGMGYGNNLPKMVPPQYQTHTNTSHPYSQQSSTQQKNQPPQYPPQMRQLPAYIPYDKRK